jgi:DNA repair exonuclease SbcCD ATPase subunit
LLLLRGGADVQAVNSLNWTAAQDDKAAQIKQVVKAAVAARVEAAKASAANAAKAAESDRELRAALAAAEREASGLTHGRAAADAKVQTLQRELAATKAELDAVANGYAHSKAALAALEAQLADAHGHGRRASGRVEALQGELAQAQATALRLQAALAASTASAAELKRVRAQAEAATAAVVDLSHEVEHLKKHLQRALAQAAAAAAAEPAHAAGVAVHAAETDALPLSEVLRNVVKFVAWGPLVLLAVGRPLDFGQLLSGVARPTRNPGTKTSKRKDQHGSGSANTGSHLIAAISGVVVCLAGIGCVI